MIEIWIITKQRGLDSGGFHDKEIRTVISRDGVDEEVYHKEYDHR